jgi:hypothetical protein
MRSNSKPFGTSKNSSSPGEWNTYDLRLTEVPRDCRDRKEEFLLQTHIGLVSFDEAFHDLTQRSASAGQLYCALPEVCSQELSRIELSVHP